RGGGLRGRPAQRGRQRGPRAALRGQREGRGRPGAAAPRGVRARAERPARALPVHREQAPARAQDGAPDPRTLQSVTGHVQLRLPTRTEVVTLAGPKPGAVAERDGAIFTVTALEPG